MTDWGRIERFSTENEDAMAVYHSKPFKNPGELGTVTFGGSIPPKCKFEDKGYATDPSDPGHKLHHAAIIGAYLHQKQVRFRLAGCVFDRPRLISVEVKD